MKQQIKDLEKKSVAELSKTVQSLKTEIAKLILERKTNPTKDTNAIAKKRKTLAQTLTVMNTKEEVVQK